MRTPFIILALAALLLAACAPVETPLDNATPNGTDNDTVPPAGEPTFREYKATSLAQCAVTTFTCDGDEGFSDETGCGCVRQHSDPAVTLCSTEYEPVCGDNGQTYSNLCMATIDDDIDAVRPGPCPPANATLCPYPRSDVCTREYRPVCGSDAQTYGNACEACSNVDVVWHLPGECATPDVPAAAQERFDEYSERFGDSLGSTLESCTREGETVFVVSGSGGFSGETSYFAADGELIGTYEWDDMVVVGEQEPQPPIDVGEYACTTIDSVQGTVTDSTEFTYQPMQCELSPWDAWYANGSITFIQAPTDSQLITAYYGGQGVDVTDVDRVETDRMVCEACGICPTTHFYRLALVSGPAGVLEDDGWEEA